MLTLEDRGALTALSDALKDAAVVHRSSAEIASDATLRARLKRRADRLEALSDQARSGVDDDQEAGSMLVLLDRLRLTVDQWFGDDDAAADAASSRAIADLIALIDDFIGGPEISEEVRAIFTAIRAQVTHGRPVARAQPTGLRSMPS
ncbi:hypothetical protein RZN05_02215 [Sphingomonas sp. HF-S4]|uniref:Uncharacterized protein n=1 Tax=Sphingomonas agrestis TaxID=3080540 RepID=A0ABU3Y345_9SPHN|nr:hypothetical protein [Sphingomonas sp. HF-S4]MDV3455784.1 hypothetical protein [Sphingomonas sp. HF-S4]